MTAGIARTSFKADWRKWYGTTKPFGFSLREALPRQWVRFYSLPYGKRYADNPKEAAIILARANRLAREVLGHGNPVWLVQCSLTDPFIPNFRPRRQKDPGRASRQLSLEHVRSFELDDLVWRVYAGQVIWQTGRFDDLLRSIADDQAAQTLFMSPSTGAVFHPYDGGVDLFTKPSRRDELRTLHPSWLSDRPDGL